MDQEAYGRFADPNEQIDAVCSRFADLLESGQHPKIDDFIARWDEPERTKLIRELLLVAVKYRWRKGEKPCREDYRDFDEHVVNEVFQRFSPVAAEEATVGGEEDTLVVDARLENKRFHDKGSLGLVYIAKDSALHRDVAVKFLRPDLCHDRESRERFLIEAEITSRLEHPGIVPVYGLGRKPDGDLFYVMRFIQGETLDDAIKAYHEPAPPKAEEEQQAGDQARTVQFRELLGRFVAVCNTIAYAHTRGIVHRDIKPANVMLGRYGETMVVDWGLAMAVGRKDVFEIEGEVTLWPLSFPKSSSSSSSGGTGGTPAYMSPEQASGAVLLTPASDIYNLGATLYRLLCGKAPFAGEVHSVRCDVVSGHFKRPTELSHGVPKPLEAICLKAMALSPGDRYRTALQLANDIENYLADAPVSAYEEPLLGKAARWSRRHRALTRGLLAGLVLLTAFVVLLAAFMGRQARITSQLHKDSLSISSRFAARTIANKVDIRLRVLEKEAADNRMHQFLEKVNRNLSENAGLNAEYDPDRKPLQEWLDACAARYKDLGSRSWFICAHEGSQVSRSPEIDPADGKRVVTLSKNYSWRDYFHGEGQDHYSDKDSGRPPRKPLTQVHISVAMESTNKDHALTIIFSAPIWPSVDSTADNTADSTPIGVLAMSIELGEFADLRIGLPEGQNILLIDTRKYHIMVDQEPHVGMGLVLQHEALARSDDRLRNLDKESLRLMELWSNTGDYDNFLPKTYRDPFADDKSATYQAAFAPVQMNGRPPDLRETGWFVIVQQRQ